MDVWQLLQIIRRRKWLVLVCAVAGLIMVSSVSHTVAPRWVSSSTLMVSAPQTSNGSSSSCYTPAVLKKLITGEEFLTRVGKAAKFDGPWDALRSMVQMKNGAEDSWGGSGNALLLEVVITAADAKTAESVCSALATEITHYLPECSSREFASNRRFLETLVSEAHDRLDKGEAAILAWQEKHQTLDLSTKAGDFTSTLARLQSEKAEYTEKVAMLKSRIDAMKGGGSIPWDLVDQKKDSLISELKHNLADERMKLAGLQQTYQPGNGRLIQQREVVKRLDETLQSEIKSEMGSLLTEKEAELQEAQAKLASAEAGIKSLRQSWSLAKNQLELSRLSRQVDSLNKNYQDLLSQLYAARVAEQAARREGSVSIIDSPGPASPVGGGGVSLRQRLPIALPMCLGFGIFVALIVEYLTASLRVRPRIEETMGLPILGVIPRMPRALTDDWDTLRRKMVRSQPLQSDEPSDAMRG